MVDYNLIRSLGVTDEQVEKEIAEALGADYTEEALGSIIEEKTSHQPGTVLIGRVVNVISDDVIVEVGLKSEGVVDLNEFADPDSVEAGMEVEVFLEEVESDTGLVVLSKRKADRIRGWKWIVENKKEGDVVTGKVTRKIKGGLLVDVSVPAFLPASQVDIRRPGDIGEYLGREIEAVILKIDKDRQNIVVSRRKLIEDRRSKAKEELLAEVEVGQLRKGVVKNIADFGAFVDLGGLDGLLHITDMSWGRINHPSDVVNIDEDIEVMVLNVDREKEKIALGLKQKGPSPWQSVEEKFPVGQHVNGSVVSIMPYGAFVKLEEGLEGLVHISEMSWTRRINHPSELVGVDEEVEVVVLNIDKEKQEISLGMRQAQGNPWAVVKEKYPPGTVISGVARSLTSFGAFIEIEEGIDGMLHVSDMSWTRKIGHPSEMINKGEEVKCVVLAVDEDKMRVSLGLKQLTEDPWLRIIPEHYLPGQIVKGKVTKLTNFGAFVELEDALEGLLHISELADHKVSSPKEIVKIGEELEVKILRVDSDERKIRLSLKRARWAAEEGEGAQLPEPEKRRGGLDGDGGLLGDIEAATMIRTTRPETDQQGEQAPEQEAPAEAKAEEAVEEKAKEPAEEPAEQPPAEAKAEQAPAEDKGDQPAPPEQAPPDPEAEKAVEEKAEQAADQADKDTK